MRGPYGRDRRRRRSGRRRGCAEPAVATVAAQVFDAPVIVPAPGEYVADGAAIQAACALTGERPMWPLRIVAEPAPDHRPLIRDQYERYAAATSVPGLASS